MTVHQNKNKITKDGRSFYFIVNYTDELGRYKQYYSKMYHTRQEAKNGEQVFRYRLSHNKVTLDITFDQLIEKYINERSTKMKSVSVGKMKVCLSHVSSSLGKIKVANLTYNQYAQFRKELDDVGYSIKYKNKLCTYAKSLVRFAQIYYGIQNDVPFMFDNYQNVANIKKELHYITIAEFKQFIICINDIRYKAYFTILFYMGLRRGEANALKWQDINFENNTLDVNKSITTANNHNWNTTTPKTQSSYRTIPMPSAVVSVLHELYDYWSKDSCFSNAYFVCGGDRPLPESSITKTKNKAFADAGFNPPFIRTHDFRHSTASLLINNGANISVVSAFLGHSNTQETLNTYAHFYGDKMQEVIDIINQKENERR